MSLIVLDYLNENIPISTLRSRFHGVTVTNRQFNMVITPVPHSFTGQKAIGFGWCEYFIENGPSGKVKVVYSMSELNDKQRLHIFKDYTYNVDTKVFRWLELNFQNVLKALLPSALDVDPDSLIFTPSVEGDGSRAETECKVYNKGAWGKQSCPDFEWNRESQNLQSQGVEVHRWCTRCVSIEQCEVAPQLAANRKKDKLSLSSAPNMDSQLA
jgi:hypothetical protein